MAKTIDIKDFINERPISAFQWFLVAMCFLVVVADGMDVAIMGFVTPPILQDWNISRPAFGFVISAAGTVTLPREERDISRPLGMSGRCDRGPPRGHRRSAKRTVRLG